MACYFPEATHRESPHRLTPVSGPGRGPGLLAGKSSRSRHPWPTGSPSPLAARPSLGPATAQRHGSLIAPGHRRLGPQIQRRPGVSCAWFPLAQEIRTRRPLVPSPRCAPRRATALLRPSCLWRPAVLSWARPGPRHFRGPMGSTRITRGAAVPGVHLRGAEPAAAPCAASPSRSQSLGFDVPLAVCAVVARLSAQPPPAVAPGRLPLPRAPGRPGASPSLLWPPPAASMAMGDAGAAAALRRLEADLRQASRHLKGLRRARIRSKTVPAALWATASYIGALRWPDLAPALVFLLRARPELEPQRAELLARLEREQAETTAEARALALSAPASNTERARLRRAHAWLQEAALHSWVRELNFDKRIAPVARLALSEATRLRRETPDAMPALPAGSRSRHQWLRRWRRRWGVALGRLAPGERPSPASCAAKAPLAPPGPPGRPPAPAGTLPGSFRRNAE